MINNLETLTFYAVDIASPYDLALHDSTNALGKILQYSLAELQVTSTGLANMWQTINGYAGRFGGKPVPADKAIACKNVAAVWAAVQAAART